MLESLIRFFTLLEALPIGPEFRWIYCFESLISVMSCRWMLLLMLYEHGNVLLVECRGRWISAVGVVDIVCDLAHPDRKSVV